MSLSLQALELLPEAAFTAALAGIFEHSPWVPAAVQAQRPFASLAALHAAMCGVVRRSPLAAQLALLRAHPELAGTPAVEPLTSASISEQAAVGLQRLAPTTAASLQALNHAYRERFGFPFILAVRGHTPDSIIATLQQRLEHTPQQELEENLAQVERIAWLRLAALLDDSAHA